MSDDGLALEARALDRRLTLRKDRCGNTAPTATIESPRDGTVRWGEVVTLSGRAADAEDAFPADFADERLVWTSSVDGLLGRGPTIWKNDLSPGRHTITFTVTDTGGLRDSAMTAITVENHAPDVRIDRPLDGATHYAGVPITFRGRAHDRESGNLIGGALTWTSDTTGALGTGTEFMAPLPAGRHTVRLTATDGALPGWADVTIDVEACPGDNCPPGVTIAAPPHRSAPVGDGSGDCVTLVASAADPEDGPLTGGSLAWTDEPDGLPATGLSETGESIEACGLVTTGGDTWHTITVTARDSGGAEATDSIRILVIFGGLW